MAKLVTIYGGSGFVGRQVAQQMARRGWRVRVAVRRPDEALFTRVYGVVGQVAPVLCNVRDEASVRLAMQDADAVVNCVNITRREGKSTFQNVFVDGAANVARISAELGVSTVVHISGIGIDPESSSRYIACKSQGEAEVLKYRPDAIVLRPSVMFGTDDHFYNRIASMARFMPIIPVVGAETKAQPVYVEDVASATAKAAAGEIASGIYELGGPDILTMRQVTRQALKAANRRRGIFDMPFWLAKIASGVMGIAQIATGGIFKNPLNRDQIALLSHNNVVAPDAKGFAAFDIQPTAPEAVIDEYLWRFRPSGQYDAIKDSAKNLRPL